jgi:Zn-dependent protease
MKWSWKLGKVSGIKIQVHWTFLILIGWVILLHVSQGADTAQVVSGVALVLAVFGCVVLHELGHALTAQRFGVQTRDITLLPIGGVARLERMPDKPSQELLVAAAGPAVNVVIAAILFALLAVTNSLRPLAEVAVVGGNLLVQLAWLNVILVAFNVLPAFPMDGGRILRALLAMKLDYVRSTQIAASIGQAMAILFGFVGLFANPILLLIAIFVYLGAQAEAQQVQLRVALEGVPVADAMMTRFRALRRADTLERAVDELLAGSQQDFPILDGERVTGMLIRADLVKALKESGRQTAVADVMREDCPMLDEDEPLERALTQMRTGKCSALPVVRRGTLVGLLTLENVGELIMVNTALRGGTDGRSRIVEVFATD